MPIRKSDMQSEQGPFVLEALVRDPKDSFERKVYRIGDLAREFGVTLRTLRFYEDRKLLVPARSGSTRLYSPEDRQRLKLILLSKRLGFSLAEIEEILEVNDREEASDEGLEKLLAKFRGQTSVLEEQRAEIEKAMVELREAIDYLEDRLNH